LNQPIDSFPVRLAPRTLCLNLNLYIYGCPLFYRIHVPYQRVNEIINGRRGITPGTALRLAKFFGVSPDFWMNIQLRWDLYFAKQSEADNLKTIKPLTVQP